ncbi:hypothetical protein [Microbulbifer variabilis]|uniref:hypothetical protein n=1 Tax=Microbulbifer variabilis TaxID=266805 RepID=UPI00037A3C78|nr:hypothetical protein [Microbulbifer variabilis]
MIEGLLIIICILLLLLLLFVRGIYSSVSRLQDDVRSQLVRESIEQSFKLNEIDSKLSSRAYLDDEQMEEFLEYIGDIREVAMEHRRQYQMLPGDREILDELNKNS